MNKFFKEFKEFAVKGNVIDMAVGIVIGGAFGKIVSSLVADIIMPLVGFLLGGSDFKAYALVLRKAVMEGETVIRPALILNYGNLIQVIIDFLIIALSIFLVIKGINKFKRKKEETPTAPAPTPEDIVLLREIRDLLSKK